MASPLAIACVGCGCVGGACMGTAAAPASFDFGPLEPVRTAMVQLADNLGFGSGDYSYGGGRWDNRSGNWRY